MSRIPPIAKEPATAADSSESLIAYCRENSRICPMPQRWVALWELLPNRARIEGGWQPPLPLILGAWDDTPELMKIIRLSEHIDWAAKHDALKPIARYLRALKEDEWFHFGN